MFLQTGIPEDSIYVRTISDRAARRGGARRLDNDNLHIGYCFHGGFPRPLHLCKGAVLYNMLDTSKIGQSFPPFIIEVGRSKIHELALAIGDNNPVYHSREAAQAAGYKDVPLYPTAPTIFNFWGNVDQWNQLRSVGISVERILHREEEFEYLAPIYPDDTLTGVTTIISGKTIKGRDGSSMDILTTETHYTNQEKKHVMSAKTIIVVQE